jgi:hypothetical protein
VRADLLDVASNAGLGQPVIDDLAAAFLDRRARDRDRSVLSEASAPQPAAAPAAATTPFLERGELSARPETPVTLMDHRKDPRVPTQQGDSMTTAGEGSLSSYLDYTGDGGMQGAASEMVASLETTVASMTTQEYGERVTGPLQQAMGRADQGTGRRKPRQVDRIGERAGRLLGRRAHRQQGIPARRIAPEIAPPRMQFGDCVMAERGHRTHPDILVEDRNIDGRDEVGH